MAYPTLVLWCDATLNKIVQGWQTNQLAAKPILKQGDSLGVEIHWVTTQGTGIASEVIFPPSSNITLAIGQVDKAPTGGSFKLTYNGDTTEDIPYDATATQIQTILNGLDSIDAEGGVTVERVGITNRIVWNDEGVRLEDMDCDVSGLSPSSDKSFAELRPGAATVRRILLFSVRQAPIAACTSFAPTAAPTVSTTLLYANTWRIKIDGQLKGGSFRLRPQVGATVYSTNPVSVFASSIDLLNALNLLVTGDNSFSVVQAEQGVWDITAPASVSLNGSTAAAVVNIGVEADLIPFSSVYGILNMGTVNVEEFLSGFQTRDAILEIEVEAGGEIQTIAQTPVTLINDLISTSVFDLVEMGQVMPVDSVVRWDTAQTISAGGKEQARLNIGAADAAEIAALEAADIALDGRIALAEAYLDQPVKVGSDVTFKSLLVTDGAASDEGLTVTGINGAGSYKAGYIDLNDPTADVAISISAINNEISITDDDGTMMMTSTGITFPGAGGTQTAAFVASDYLAKADSLAGIASASVARSNLGLGTMALEASTSFLTAASATATYLPITTAATLYAPLSSIPDQDVSTTASPTFARVILLDGVGTGAIEFQDGSTLETRPVEIVQANGGGYDSPAFETVYPYEIKVQDSSGTWYWVPARPV